MRYLPKTICSIVLTLGMAGCSVKQMAVNSLAETLCESNSVFASDNDPELIRQALPFSLKLIEGLLAESPNNRNLLLAASSGFTQYAYALVGVRPRENSLTCRPEWQRRASPSSAGGVVSPVVG